MIFSEKFLRPGRPAAKEENRICKKAAAALYYRVLK